MDRQAVFDKVWDHFIVQQQPLSFDVRDDEVFCQYRGPDGAKCALGVLIPDDLYDGRMDDINMTANQLLADYVSVRTYLGIGPEVGSTDWLFLQALQGAHDNYARAVHFGFETPDLADKFRAVARTFNLQVPA